MVSFPNKPRPISSPAKKKMHPLLLLLIVFGIIFATSVFSFIIFGFGMGVVLFVALFTAGVMYLIMKWWYEYRQKPMLTLEQAAYLTMMESCEMGRLAVPLPLKVKLHPNATIMGHPGDVYAMTHAPADKSFFKMAGEKAVLENGEDNKVWCFRMRLKHKRGRDDYIALVCDSQISRFCLDATGKFDWTTPILSYGHWGKHGLFYVLYNNTVELAREHGVMGTLKALEAFRVEQDRLADAVEANARSKPEIVDSRENRKRVIEAAD